MRPKADSGFHHSLQSINCLYEDLLSEFHDQLKNGIVSDVTCNAKVGAARHFLIWLELKGIALHSIDEAILLSYRDHKCHCFARKNGAKRQGHRSGNRRNTMRQVLRFVQFLEDTGRIEHPDEMSMGNGVLQQFLDELKVRGFRPSVRDCYHDISHHFLVWLHRCRTSIKTVDAEVLDRFFWHDCLCPNHVRSPSHYAAAGLYAGYLRKFVNFLVKQGVVPEPLEVAETKPAGELDGFCSWLEHIRGQGAQTIRKYRYTVSSLLTDLGPDPSQYDAKLIRQVLLKRFAGVSTGQAKVLTRCMRMYLRYLSSTGASPAALVNSVLAPRSYQFATLPRYICMDDIERVIASCDTATAAGTRDRAVLLLLARLGLRAGDVLNLRLSDIDWNNAQIQLCGKSRRETKLPLPQDAGDALFAYITTVRPRGETAKVFLRSRAPHGPLKGSTSISSIVFRAVTRAGVESPGGRGAHLLRHSVATHMLRTGASMDLVGALLRHKSPRTTMLYAKTDIRMLQEVAQPWLGGAR